MKFQSPVTLLLLTILLPAMHAAIIKGTCPCRLRPSAGVSICAVQAGDPNWCNFHVCAPSYECIDASWATHTCQKKETLGTHKCLFDKNGKVVKPSPQSVNRCKCKHHSRAVIHHISPIA